MAKHLRLCLFIFLFLNSLIAAAQTDSVIIEHSYDIYYSSGTLQSRKITKFDHFGRIREIENSGWNNKRWKATSKTINQHDNNGNLTEAKVFLSNGQQWYPYSATLNFFGNFNRLDSSISEYWLLGDKNPSTTFPSHYYYDGFDSIVSKDEMTYQDHIIYTTFYRDQNNFDTLEIKQDYEIPIQILHDISKTRKTYSGNKLSSSTTLIPYYGIWMNSDSTGYEYDANDSLLFIRSYSFNGTQFTLIKSDSLIYSGDTLFTYHGEPDINDSVIYATANIIFDDGSGYNSYAATQQFSNSIWYRNVTLSNTFDSLQHIHFLNDFRNGKSTRTQYDSDGHQIYSIQSSDGTFGSFYADSVLYYYYRTEGNPGICIGGNDSLTAPPFMSNYTWSNSTPGNYTIVYSPGQYSCSFTNQFGHTFRSEPLFIDYALQPFFPAANDSSITVCKNAASDWLLSWHDASIDYQWYKNDTAIFIPGVIDSHLGIQYLADKNDGDFYLVASNQCGTDTSATTHISFRSTPLPLLPYGNITLCHGDTIILRAPAGFTNYNWDNGINGIDTAIAVFNQLPPKLYATDAFGCLSVSEDTIIQPLLSIDPTINQIGDSILKTFLPENLSINWYKDGQLLTDTMNYLVYHGAGTYTAVYQTGGCTDSISAGIYPDFFSLIEDEYQVNKLRCIGDTVHFENLYTLNFGIAPYHFQWSPASSVSSDTVANPFTIAGTDTVFNLVVTDSAGNSISAEFHLHINTPMQPLISAVNDTNCYQQTHRIIAPNCGAGVYNWHLDNHSVFTTFQNYVDVNLNGQWYLVYDNGCLNTSNTITTYEYPQHQLSLAATNVPLDFCNVDSILLIAKTDDPSLMNFSWERTYLNVFYFTEQLNTNNDTLTIRQGGNYNVTMTDTNGCMYFESYSFSGVLNQNINTTITPTGVYSACQGDTITLTVHSPQNYSYNWFSADDPLHSFGKDSIFLASYSGEYVVHIYNSFGCEGSDTVTVSFDSQPSTLFLTYNNYMIYGVVNHYPSYAQWYRNDTLLVGENNVNIHPTLAGIYKLVIESACGNLVDSMQISCGASISYTMPTCAGACDGSAEVTSYGVHPVTQLWSNASGQTQISGLCTGDYWVQVTDFNGCYSLDSVHIPEPSMLVINTTTSHASCDTCADGNAVVTIQGGTAPYTISWSNGDSTTNVSGLAPGTYAVCVTDVNQCSACSNVLIEGVIGIFDPEYSNQVLMYPNPAITSVHLEMKGNGFTGENRVVVTDLSGKKVLEKNFCGEKMELNVGILSVGMYFLQIISEQGNTVHCSIAINK